jgi:hypothetical protein
MSWEIFKQNVLNVMSRPESINDIDTVARTFAREYDFAVRRGGDTINKVAIKKGNVELMEQLFKSALQKGLSATQPYDLVGEMGKGVIAYWTGAIMNEFPIPIIPSIGSVSNIGVASNIVTNAGVWTPIIPTPIDSTLLDVYKKLDFSKIPLDKNSEEVQDIINPSIDKINRRLSQDLDIGNDVQLGSARITQLDNVVAEIIDTAMYGQGLIKVDNIDTSLESGYRNLDELLKIAGKLAPQLGKNPRINYQTLKSNYIKTIHGLCPQGTQCVVAALTGVKELGRISGNADWFSFKEPSTGGGRSSFSNPINGQIYYNDKIRVGKEYINNSSQWQVGDIIANGYLDDKKYGHIQVWTGFKWVSDFTQNRIQTNKVDFSTVALWRLSEVGKQVVQMQKDK